MKYFSVNEELNKTISQIQQDITLSMNGICAENITNSGLTYSKNYGVSFARLREIATKYTPNYDLAYRIWQLSIRETKILATILCPPEKINTNNIKEWINEIPTTEIAEISSLTLFSKVHNINDILIDMLSNDKYLTRLTAYHTLSRTIKQLTEHEICEILNKIEPTDIEQISACRAIENIIYIAQSIKTEHITKQLNALKTRLEETPQHYTAIILDMMR